MEPTTSVGYRRSVGIRPSARTLESARAGRGPTRDILREGAAMDRMRMSFRASEASPTEPAVDSRPALGLVLALKMW